MKVKISSKGKRLVSNRDLADSVVKEIMNSIDNKTFEDKGLTVTNNGDVVILKSVASHLKQADQAHHITNAK